MQVKRISISKNVPKDMKKGRNRLIFAVELREFTVPLYSSFLKISSSA
jgi:hypothetical protein